MFTAILSDSLRIATRTEHRDLPRARDEKLVRRPVVTREQDREPTQTRGR